MLRTFSFFTLILVASSLSAQISAGLAIGQQRYQSAEDNPKVTTDADVLLRRNDFGLHLAVQYADLSTIDGPLIAIHPDLVYRRAFSDNSYVLLGAGPSFIQVGSTMNTMTWNAEGELGLVLRKADVFVRVRQFDFSLSEFRVGEAGPSGPTISIGARFALSH